jgi:diphosphomevalonate decarboxylase
MTTAIAHPNIALVKYWGKRDAELNLPAAGSLSVTLAGMETRTTVEFDPALPRDEISLDGEHASGRPATRVSAFLDLVRERAGIATRARVTSENDFPTAAGLASSASGFAALALAASDAAGLDMSPEELSVLARRGSGSAARSLFGGYVEMKPGTRADGADAHAVPLFDGEYWPLECLVAVTVEGPKKVSSTVGMNHTMETSPYYDQWVASVAPAIERAKEAIDARDFTALATIAEASCMQMHASAIAAEPGVLYWRGVTVELIHAVRDLRAAGASAFFSIDAGPHVKVFCTPGDRPAVEAGLRKVQGVVDVIHATIGGASRLVS